MTTDTMDKTEEIEETEKCLYTEIENKRIYSQRKREQCRNSFDIGILQGIFGTTKYDFEI